MLLARHGHVGAECCLELLKLRTAEALARLGGSTDWAMILDQQETAVFLPLELRHIALGGSQSGQGTDAISEIGVRRQCLAVGCHHCFLPRLDQAV